MQEVDERHEGFLKNLLTVKHRCIYLKLKGNVSRCDRKIIMWVEFLTLVDAGLTAHLTRVWSQFSRLHSWIWTLTVLHYNLRRRNVQLINPRVSDKQASIMQTLDSSCAAFNRSPPWETTTSRNTYAFQEVSTALLWANGSDWNILRTPKTNPLPGPTGIHTWVEIKECIYEHLALVQWGQCTDRHG